MSKYWTTEPSGYVEPVIGESGAASFPARTVIETFYSTVQKHGDRNALAVKIPVDGKTPKDWKFWTWNQYWNDCRLFAKSLVHLNVSSFRVINILGFNSPEWFIANTGAIMGAGIAAGIYTTNNPEACKYITLHSQAEVVVVEGNKQLEKYTKVNISDLTFLKAIVVWGEPIDEKLKSKFVVPVYTWDTFLTLGSKIDDDVIDSRLSLVKPGNCSTLIYTSGTTGPPKAVMISHDNITWTTKVIADHYMDLNHTERIVSYLPLSHIAAQVVDIHAVMYLGGCTYFALPDALKGSLTVTLRDVRPTFFFGVPRVWEKIQEKMVQLGRESTGIKKLLATWAKSIGLEHSKRAQYGEDGSAPWGYGCANTIVLSKIKEALGLEQCKGCFSAAAPIAPETVWYFASLDLPIYEVFGQSECTGPHTVSFAKKWRVGYVGRPIPGSESKLDPINGELSYRGRHIFMGYMHMPDKTAETIDNEGYLHSGDVAEFDGNDDPNVKSPSGFLRITGRIKELIITAGGENIPPVLIENEMKAALVAVSNAMVVGERKKFLCMLITLKTEIDPESGAPTDKLAADSLFVAKQIGSNATTVQEAINDPLWTKYINDGVKVGNSKTTSNAQIIQKWKILPVDFSEKGGELTPTLKLKRNVATEKYASVIDALYLGAD
eukprot:gene20864-27042_t